MAEIVPDLGSPAELIEQGRLHLEEAALQLRAIAAHTQSDPDQLDEIEERLALLKRLSKKYAAPASELPGFLARVEEELAALESHADNRDRAAEAVDRSLRGSRDDTRLHSVASDERSPRRLEKAMARELGDLGMAGGVFKVEQETSTMQSIDELGPTGADRVEFFLSANPGEPTQPLARVASGGELSRILLALKALDRRHRRNPGADLRRGRRRHRGNHRGRGRPQAARSGRRIARSSASPTCPRSPPAPTNISRSRSASATVAPSARPGRCDDEDRIAELSRMLGSSSDEAARYARELISEGRKPIRRGKRPTSRRSLTPSELPYYIATNRFWGGSADSRRDCRRRA